MVKIELASHVYIQSKSMITSHGDNEVLSPTQYGNGRDWRYHLYLNDGKRSHFSNFPIHITNLVSHHDWKFLWPFGDIVLV